MGGLQRRPIAIAAAAVALLLVATGVWLATDDNNPDQSGDEPTSAECVAPQTGDRLRDQDRSDHQVPWERKGQDKVRIYFAADGVGKAYRGYLDQGASAWNGSPCLDVQVVDDCPDDTNCVTVSVTKGHSADGNFESVERKRFTVGGHIDLYYQELNKLGNGAKLNVTIHEMGHAVGLRHRKAEHVLMNGDTYTDVFDPDEIDYHNLLVLYGGQA